MLVGPIAHAQAFYVSDFRDTTAFTYINIGTPTPVLELKPGGDRRPMVGGIWREAPVDIGTAWSTTFRFQITDTGGAADAQGYSGADGLAFVIQLEGPEAIGTAGYGLGYHGILGGIAFEVDTWDDSMEPIWGGKTEDSSAHVAMQSNATDYLTALPSDSWLKASRRLSVDVSDGLIHTLAVTYTPGRIRVYLDDCAAPIISYEIWLDTWLAQKDAYIGITAATQSAWQKHRIHSWCFAPSSLGCGCPEPCDTLIVEVHDTTIVVTPPDTLFRDRIIYVDHFDTVYIRTHDTIGAGDTLYIVRVDSVPYPVPYAVHDTTIIERIDSIPYSV